MKKIESIIREMEEACDRLKQEYFNNDPIAALRADVEIKTLKKVISSLKTLDEGEERKIFEETFFVIEAHYTLPHDTTQLSTLFLARDVQAGKTFVQNTIGQMQGQIIDLRSRKAAVVA